MAVSVKNACAIIVILLFIAGVMVVVDRSFAGSTATTASPTITATPSHTTSTASTTSTAPDNVMPEAVDNVAATAPQAVAEIELDDQAAAAFAELGPRDSGYHSATAPTCHS